MANRNISPLQSVTKVSGEPSEMEGLIGAAADFAGKVVMDSARTSMGERFSETQIAVNELEANYKQQYQSNPDEGKNAFRDDVNKILTQGRKDTPYILSSEWDENAKKLRASSNLSYSNWSIKQNMENSVLGFKNTMRNNYKQATADGMRYATDDAAELDGLMNLEVARNSIQNMGDTTIGGTQTEKLLENYDRDYTRAFFYGVIQKNPLKAEKLLDKVSDFEDRMRFETLIKKYKRAEELETKKAQSANYTAALDMILNGGKDYTSTAADIDGAVVGGQLTPEMGASLMNYANSPNAIGAVDDPATQVAVYDRIARLADPEYTRLLDVEQIRRLEYNAKPTASSAIALVNARAAVQKYITGSEDEALEADVRQKAHDLVSTVKEVPDSNSTVRFLQGGDMLKSWILAEGAIGRMSHKGAKDALNTAESILNRKEAEVTTAWLDGYGEYKKAINTSIPLVDRNTVARNVILKHKPEWTRGDWAKATAYEIDRYNGGIRKKAMEEWENTMRLNFGLDDANTVATEKMLSQGITQAQINRTAQLYGLTPAQVLQRLEEHDRTRQSQ